MGRVSRREAGKMLVAGSAGLLLAPELASSGEMINSVIRGVRIGAQSYSFRDRPLAAALDAYRAVGIGISELYQGHVEAHREFDAASREKLRQWRLTVPLSHFHNVRQQFDNAGVLLYAYNYSFRKEMTEEEVDRGFQMAQALGVKYMTASGNVSDAPRIDRHAQKYRITVGFHGHDETDKPDEFSTPETFARAMRGTSRYIAVNLDIGHFTAAGGDAVEYIRQHHDRIVTLHVKDRKKNHGSNMPFGQGDTPIVGVLRLLRDNGWTVPANIEYEYGEEIPGLDTLAEMKKCFAYCKQAVET